MSNIWGSLQIYLGEIRNSKKADGHDRIYIHGAKEFEAEKKALKNGIAVNEKTWIEINQIAKELNMDTEEYFGHISV